MNLFLIRSLMAIAMTLTIYEGTAWSYGGTSHHDPPATAAVIPAEQLQNGEKIVIGADDRDIGMTSTTADDILGGGVNASGGSVNSKRGSVRHCEMTAKRP